jgi:hypothetical protein
MIRYQSDPILMMMSGRSAGCPTELLTMGVAFAALLASCDRSPPPPRSMWTEAERFEADLSTAVPPTGAVIASVHADDGGPVGWDVFVGLTLIGPDGGDGGFQEFLVGRDGQLRIPPQFAPGRYQYDLRPHPRSPYRHTFWRNGDPYLVVPPLPGVPPPRLYLKPSRSSPEMRGTRE